MNNKIFLRFSVLFITRIDFSSTPDFRVLYTQWTTHIITKSLLQYDPFSNGEQNVSGSLSHDDVGRVPFSFQCYRTLFYVQSPHQNEIYEIEIWNIRSLLFILRFLHEIIYRYTYILLLATCSCNQ